MQSSVTATVIELGRNVPKMSQFLWTKNKSRAAVLLAEGRTQQQIADGLGLARRTIGRWLRDSEFAAEVARLSQMINTSSRAAWLRLAMRVVREKTKGEKIDTDKDLLDWLKFAQSETDGIKLGLSALSQRYPPVHN